MLCAQIRLEVKNSVFSMGRKERIQEVSTGWIPDNKGHAGTGLTYRFVWRSRRFGQTCFDLRSQILNLLKSTRHKKRPRKGTFFMSGAPDRIIRRILRLTPSGLSSYTPMFKIAPCNFVEPKVLINPQEHQTKNPAVAGSCVWCARQDSNL